MFEYTPMPEYKLIYCWDAEHWTCITSSDIPVDICEYFKKNLAEMQEAMEVSEDAHYIIEYHYGATLVKAWYGTPDELYKVIDDITNSWLSKAFT